MAGRPKRKKDAALATRLDEWRRASELTRSSVAEQLGVAASTITRSLKTNSFSPDLRARVLALLLDDQGAAQDTVQPGRWFVDRISANDLRFLQEFVNHILPKVEEVLKSALRRPHVGEKS